MNARENQRRNIEAGDGAGRSVRGGTGSRIADRSRVAAEDVSHPSNSAWRLPQFLTIAIVITIIDQITKWCIVSRMLEYQSVPVLPGILSITRIHNSGIAFGLFPGLPDLFMVVTLISILVVVYFYLTARPRGNLLTIGCALILGGAVGNLIDRFRLGYVIDYINFSFWPAFNVADSAVSVGVMLLLVFFYLGGRKRGSDASGSVQDRPV